MTYVERLIELKLIPLVYDRERKDIVFYFKCKNNLIDLDISQYVETMSSRVQAPLASYEQHYVELAHSKTPILLES